MTTPADRIRDLEAALTEVLDWWASAEGILTHDYEQGYISQPDYPNEFDFDDMMAAINGSHEEAMGILAFDDSGNLSRYLRWSDVLHGASREAPR